jgi:hypothetical protein
MPTRCRWRDRRWLLRRLAGALGAAGAFGTGCGGCRNGRGCAPFTPGSKAGAVLVDFKPGTVGEGADGEREHVTPECVQGLIRVRARIEQGTA